MDTLARDLGVEFKPSKDEGFDKPTYAMDFLGHHLTTSPVVMAHPSPAKVTKLGE